MIRLPINKAEGVVRDIYELMPELKRVNEIRGRACKGWIPGYIHPVLYIELIYTLKDRQRVLVTIEPFECKVLGYPIYI